MTGRRLLNPWTTAALRMCKGIFSIMKHFHLIKCYCVFGKSWKHPAPISMLLSSSWQIWSPRAFCIYVKTRAQITQPPKQLDQEPQKEALIQIIWTSASSWWETNKTITGAATKLPFQMLTAAMWSTTSRAKTNPGFVPAGDTSDLKAEDVLAWTDTMYFAMLGFLSVWTGTKLIEVYKIIRWDKNRKGKLIHVFVILEPKEAEECLNWSGSVWKIHSTCFNSTSSMKKLESCLSGSLQLLMWTHQV